MKEKLISDKSKILFVDDGSKDLTWELIYQASLQSEMIRGLKLARNAGHQHALLAGLLSAKTVSDCVISIDADLQDDIEVIRTFIEKFKDGHDIVYGVRKRRPKYIVDVDLFNLSISQTVRENETIDEEFLLKRTNQ